MLVCFIILHGRWVTFLYWKQNLGDWPLTNHFQCPFSYLHHRKNQYIWTMYLKQMIMDINHLNSQPPAASHNSSLALIVSMDNLPTQPALTKVWYSFDWKNSQTHWTTGNRKCLHLMCASVSGSYLFLNTLFSSQSLDQIKLIKTSIPLPVLPACTGCRSNIAQGIISQQEFDFPKGQIICNFNQVLITVWVRLD